MGAVDEIRAAIRKLERLRAGSTVGPWQAGPYLYASDDDRVRVTAPGDGDDYNTADSVLPEDADLIVTLHRTIDAQIAILWLANEFAGISNNRYTDAALTLARAINGGA